MNDIVLPDASPKLLTAMEIATAFVVDSPESFQLADSACVELMHIKKEVQDRWHESKTKAHEAHTAICAMEKNELSRVDAIRTEYKTKMNAWRKTEEVKRLAAEAALREQARRASETMALTLAESIEKNGGDGTRILDKIIKTPPVVHLESAVPKAQTRTRELWEIESIDEGKLPDEYWIPNLHAIAGIVRIKKVANPIPGVIARARMV